MTCQGHERDISECHFDDHSQHNHPCSGREKAGIKCRKSSKTCEEYEFHCRNKECINVNRLCDGQPDCGDGSDEEARRCNLPLQVCNNITLYA